MASSSSYQEALQQLQNLTSKPLPIGVQYTAIKAMEKELARPETTQSLFREVKQLIEDIIKIDQAFERVKTELGRIDDRIFIGKPAEDFQPRWIGIQQRFVVLIWSSYKTAKQTGAYVRGTFTQFVDVILPGLEEIQNYTDYTVVAADLKEFTSSTGPFGGRFEAQNQARKCSLAYTDLRHDIEAFKDGFDLFTQEQGVEPHEDMVHLHGEIDRLKIEIKRCKFMVLAIGTSLGVSTSFAEVGSIASLATLGLLGPATTTKIFLAGTAPALLGFKSLVAFISRISEHKGALSRVHVEMNNLMARDRLLEQLQTTLKIQGAGINDVCKRIDQLNVIYSYVLHDAELIAADLKAVIRGADSKVFLARLKLIRGTYGALAYALKEYTMRIEGHSFRFGQADYKSS
ncbi:hypothetical protein D9615_008556 [Tricholomella constricta]|uniref:Uncharacterized protein n=1 Tax=Tricholomella constricta TaxID=117010 RepID=A0A8H5H436_9AGAR|nr:hypothetical protein D9615_008556 [Tricholomella constricta]